MKNYFEPIKTLGRSGIKITIPMWALPVASAFKFEKLPDGTLQYKPVIR
jgi:hypothetical protein